MFGEGGAMIGYMDTSGTLKKPEEYTPEERDALRQQYDYFSNLPHAYTEKDRAYIQEVLCRRQESVE